MSKSPRLRYDVCFSGLRMLKIAERDRNVALSIAEYISALKLPSPAQISRPSS
jgi:hypothetical protein